jgi:hypothetical protein
MGHDSEAVMKDPGAQSSHCGLLCLKSIAWPFGMEAHCHMMHGTKSCLNGQLQSSRPLPQSASAELVVPCCRSMICH